MSAGQMHSSVCETAFEEDAHVRPHRCTGALLRAEQVTRGFKACVTDRQTDTSSLASRPRRPAELTVAEVAEVARVEEEVRSEELAEAALAGPEGQGRVQVQAARPVRLSAQVVSWRGQRSPG